MRTLFFLSIAAGLFCWMGGANLLHAQTPAQVAEKVFVLTNEYRASRNLPALQPSAIVAREALAHSQAMAARQYELGHDGFRERLERIKPVLMHRGAGENVGYVKITSGDIAGRAMEMWKGSPGHNENLLGDYDIIGIGVATNAKGETYLTQIFLRSSSSAAQGNAPARRPAASSRNRTGFIVQPL